MSSQTLESFGSNYHQTKALMRHSHMCGWEALQDEVIVAFERVVVQPSGSDQEEKVQC